MFLHRVINDVKDLDLYFAILVFLGSVRKFSETAYIIIWSFPPASENRPTKSGDLDLAIDIRYRGFFRREMSVVKGQTFASFAKQRQFDSTMHLLLTNYTTLEHDFDKMKY